MVEETTTPTKPVPLAPGVEQETIHSAASDIESLISDDFTTGEDQPEEEAEKKKDIKAKEKPAPESEEESEEEIDEEVDETSDESEEEDESEEDDDTEEEDLEPEYTTVTIDGKEHQVTQDELIKGYHRQNDYTKKTQAVSEQRKELDTELMAIRSERQRYAENLQQMGKNADAELKKFEQIDWAELKEEDPEEYRDKKDEYRDFKEAKIEIQEEKEKVLQSHRKDQINRYRVVAKEEIGKLIGKIPAWKDKEKFKIGMSRLIKYGKSLGYEEKEINDILDHRHLVAIEKARKFDAFEKADPSKRKVKGKPRITKPGGQGSKKRVSKNLRSKEGMDRLKATGGVKEAADLIANMDFE